jgi:hypothetical protein
VAIDPSGLATSRRTANLLEADVLLVPVESLLLLGIAPTTRGWTQIYSDGPPFSCETEIKDFSEELLRSASGARRKLSGRTCRRNSS